MNSLSVIFPSIHHSAVCLNQSGRPLISTSLKIRSASDFKKFGIFPNNSSVSSTDVGSNTSRHVTIFLSRGSSLKRTLVLSLFSILSSGFKNPRTLE